MKLKDMSDNQKDELVRIIEDGRTNELDPELLNDKEFLLYYDVIDEKDTLLRYVTDKELFKDKEFIIQYIIETGSPDYIFRYVDESLKSDRPFLIELMQRVHDDFENDQIHQLYGGILQNVNPDFKNDREFVYNAVRIFPEDFQNASLELRNEKAFVLELLELMDEEFGWPEYYEKESIYKYRGETLIDDKDIFIAAVTNYANAGMSYDRHEEQNYLSSELSKDRGCILESIKGYSDWFEYADDELKKKKDFIMQCLLINPDIYEFLTEEQLKDKDIYECRLSGLINTTKDSSYRSLKSWEELLNRDIAKNAERISNSRNALLKRIIAKQDLLVKQKRELMQLGERLF